MLVPWSFGSFQGLLSLPLTSLISVLYLALISTNFAYLAWNRALSGLTTHQAAGWIYAVPLITAVTAIPLVGESLTYSLVGGGVLIVSGVILVGRRAPG